MADEIYREVELADKSGRVIGEATIEYKEQGVPTVVVLNGNAFVRVHGSLYGEVSTGEVVAGSLKKED